MIVEEPASHFLFENPNSETELVCFSEVTTGGAMQELYVDETCAS